MIIVYSVLDNPFTNDCILGDQIWTQNGSDWPQMGQIRVFSRSDFSAFGAPNLTWKSP